MSTLELQGNDFEEKVLSSKVALLDFWTEGCGPCQALAKELEKVAAERKDIKVYKANVETENDLAGKLGVMAAPTLFFFKNGEIRKKTIGFKSSKSILEVLDQINEE